MSKIKKFAAFALITAMSLSVTACSSNAEGAATETPAATATETPTETDAALEEEESTVADDAVIAKVGDTEVYGKAYNDLYNYQVMMAYYQYGSALQTAEGASYLNALKANCYETVISQEVIYQKAVEEGKIATEEEITQAMEDDKSNYDTDEAYQEAIKENYGSEEDYKAEVERSLTINNYLDELQNSVKITDDEIQQYYDANKDSFVEEAGANMKHILVRIDSSKAADDANYESECEEKAKEIKKQLDEGADFDELMAQYQEEDPNKETYAAEDLGFVAYNNANYDQDFLKGAAGVKEGEISDPVKSSFGWHIIKVEGITEERTKTLDEVKDMITSTLSNNGLQQKVEELKNAATIERHEDVIGLS